jgi:hypothetical protein
MLRKSCLTIGTVVAFSTVLNPVFAGGVSDMGHRPAPVYHPVVPVEVPTQVVYPCEGPALKEGQWTFTARAGIAPTTRNKKAHISQSFVNGVTDGVVRTRFKNHNDLPFTTGFDVGYVPIDNTEVFFNFDYVYAGSSHKRHVHNSIADPHGTIHLSTRYKQGDFNSYGFYFGGRYFFDIADCKFSPFVGAKLGVLYRNNERRNVRVIITQNNSVLLNGHYRAPLHRDSTGFSGGIQAGLDYCVSDPVSLFLMAEAIGGTNSNSHTHRRLVFTDALRNDRLYTRGSHKSGSTFAFPITAGVKVRM